MKMNELISVIIPAYNCQDTITKCLISIEQQTYTNLEIIIVNDGSTDNTLTMIKRQMDHDTRIVLLNQENKGVSAARNAALDIAKGAYISFVDADDYVEGAYIEELYFALTKYKVNICLCDYSAESETGNEVFNKKKKVSKEVTDVKYFSITQGFSYDDGSFDLSSIWGKLFKKTVIKDVRFSTDLYVGEDLLFMAQTAKNSREMVYINIKLYHYIIYKNSAIHGVFDEKKYTEIMAWERVLECFEDISYIYNSACIRYGINCRRIIIENYGLSPFMDNYYYLIMKHYRQNLKYLLMSSNLTVLKKIGSVFFLICPNFYIKLRAIIKKIGKA